MLRHRLRIGLLALGVLLGYGSAFAELRHQSRQHAHHEHGACCLWE
jgi:hypothetical protein